MKKCIATMAARLTPHEQILLISLAALMIGAAIGFADYHVMFHHAPIVIDGPFK
ncbi:MAG: hypothetical protein G01um101456_748 [Parcubacteria group bacterium Gr01-1014_56]|nr:MAG: hypothetical protein G01um101456_748 [Parcubacteria group bacterium Gr01-1014_56]